MIIIAVALFACWGSFLKAVADRLIAGQSLLPRSACPHCKQTLSWHHLIPLCSWIRLRGRCAYCNATIGWLYPFIELITAASLTALLYQSSLNYFPAYFLLFSALIVTIATDLEHMLILRIMTIGIIPFGFLAAWCGYLPITLVASIAGALLGAGLLYALRALFFALKGQEGLGMGDVELLAAIGAFTGHYGIMIVNILGSALALSAALIFILCTQEKNYRQLKIPFGAFLAAGTMLYVLLFSSR